MARQSVFVALSGGVDSALAAALLQEQGYEVVAVFMRNWMDDDGRPECTSLADWLSARRVCDHLGIELRQVNFSQLYKEKVFNPFLRGLIGGTTPNPDVLCNHFIKFQALKHYVHHQGGQLLATGHYARLVSTQLHRAYDRAKCQTYFLFAVNNFDNCLMPLGDLSKSEVRSMAKKRRLPNYARKDSTGLCFIGERNFSRFISRYLKDDPGDIVDGQGKLRGQHRGLFHYTIGQRRGLGIGGNNDSAHSAWYVIDKDKRHNRLIVAQQTNALYASEIHINNLHWINEPPDFPLNCQVQIRYRSQSSSCIVSEPKGGYCSLRFAEPQKAATPGQAAVLYQGERCLGGGFIVSSI